MKENNTPEFSNKKKDQLYLFESKLKFMKKRWKKSKFYIKQ